MIPFMPFSSQSEVGLPKANGRMVVILGPTLGSALLRAGLVDQIFLQVAPVVIGAGVKIFADTGEPPVHLTLVHSSQA